MKIQIKILNKEFYTEDNLPSYATSGSAAMDLVCTEDTIIYPQQRVKIPTGLAIWIGDKNVWNAAALILPRSGLGTKGLNLANTIGLIDSDYQGELVVSAWNSNEELRFINNINCEDVPPIKLKAGDRFAQLLFIPVIKAQWDIVEEFISYTSRGDGGFGSTGK